MRIFGFKLPNMTSLILWGLLWEVLGRLEVSFFLPPLSSIFTTLLDIYDSKAFIRALNETAIAFFGGLFYALVIGIPLGIFMGKNRFIDELFLPWVNMFMSAPLTALVPVLMVLFGFGLKSIIIVTTLFAIWIIILNTRAGVKQINRSLVDMANSFGASPIDAFVKIYFWAALPEIIGQLLISIVGFGSLFELYSSRFLMSHFWAIIIVLFALAFTISELLAMLAKRFDYYASKRG